jgi:hypothetical protein
MNFRVQNSVTILPSVPPKARGASDVAAAVVSLLGHVDGTEWTVGVFDFGGASALTALRSHFGGLTWRQRAARLLGAVREFF